MQADVLLHPFFVNRGGADRTDKSNGSNKSNETNKTNGTDRQMGLIRGMNLMALTASLQKRGADHLTMKMGLSPFGRIVRYLLFARVDSA